LKRKYRRLVTRCTIPYICCSCSADWFSCGHCLTTWLSTDRKLRNKIFHSYLQLHALITRRSAEIVLVYNFTSPCIWRNIVCFQFFTWYWSCGQWILSNVPQELKSSMQYLDFLIVKFLFQFYLISSSISYLLQLCLTELPCGSFGMPY